MGTLISRILFLYFQKYCPEITSLEQREFIQVIVIKTNTMYAAVWLWVQFLVENFLVGSKLLM